MRLFEPDIVHLCWECSDPLGDELVVPASQPGYWSHVPCDLEAALEADADASRSATGGQMVGAYSARFPSAPRGDIPARVRPPAAASARSPGRPPPG